MKKRLLAALLALVTALGLFSCEKAKTDETTSETTETTTEERQENYEFLVSDLGNYCIVYADGLSMDTFKKVRELQFLLEQKFGVKLETSGKEKAVQAKEILIGKTGRADAAEIFALAPKAKDYAIGATGEKLVVAAHNDQMISAALDVLLDAVKGLQSDSRVFFELSMGKVVTGEYPMNTILLGAYDIKDYAIVYDDSAEGIALSGRVHEAILNKCGFDLEMSTTLIEGKMILVGRTAKGAPDGMVSNTKDYFYMGMDGDDLYLYGAELPAAYRAVNAFCELVNSATGEIATLDADRGTVEAVDRSLVSMSFNVLYKITDTARVDYVISTIRSHKPDTFGVQEAGEQWMEYLNEAFSDEYAFVGEGRDPNGSNEYNAIFYRKDKLELIESGTKWMSDTPDVVGSKLTGSAYPRVFTYALLQVKGTGERFIHVNTHTDHIGNDGQVRLKQIQVLVDFLKTHYADIPTIVTGDMNEVVSKPSMKYLRMSGFENSSEIAVVGDASPTFKTSVIDFLWTSTDDFFIYQYQVDTTKYNGEYSSDHRAIVVRYQLS